MEGHVNRLKTIKRQMYGRAGFVLLRRGCSTRPDREVTVATLPGLARPASSKVRESLKLSLSCSGSSHATNRLARRGAE